VLASAAERRRTFIHPVSDACTGTLRRLTVWSSLVHSMYKTRASRKGQLAGVWSRVFDILASAFSHSLRAQARLDAAWPLKLEEMRWIE
jgi:hypothetical protein